MSINITKAENGWVAKTSGSQTPAVFTDYDLLLDFIKAAINPDEETSSQ